MREADIPRFNIEQVTSPDVRNLRTNTPNYFIELIELGFLENVSSIRDVAPGSMVAMNGLSNASYFFRDNRSPRVVKFGHFSATAEARMLNLLREKQVSVPQVLGSGIVPSTEGKGKPVEYIVLEGIEKDGQPAPTGYGYLEKQQDQETAIDQAWILGECMADELVKVHNVAPDDMVIGGVLDTPDGTAETIYDYFTKKIDDPGSTNLLNSLGIDINRMKAAFETTQFPETGSMVFGDFLPYNVVVESESPSLTIKILDPTPSTNDPYWDIARFVNTFDLTEALTRDHPKNQEYSDKLEQEKHLRDGFLGRYVVQAGELDPKRLLANQIIFAVGHIQRREARADTIGSAGLAQIPFEKERVVDLMKELLKEYIAEFMELT
ncbi:MAG TPA: hypothetical protein VM077_06045 [Candidatus Limnocylindrales bacterium]|nr:hypothetical protein [Candidatus Limnocylindrales bacterium]